MARTYGAYMLQPSKDELRATIWQLRQERDTARDKVEGLTEKLAETQERLTEAYRLLGQQRVDVSLARKKKAVG